MCLTKKICSICKKYYDESLTLSRKDNKTKYVVIVNKEKP